MAVSDVGERTQEESEARLSKLVNICGGNWLFSGNEDSGEEESEPHGLGELAESELLRGRGGAGDGVLMAA